MSRHKQFTQIITGLDIGSTAVRIAVGQVVPAQNGLRSHLQIIGTAEVASEGIQKGSITSIEEAVSTISHVLEEVEHMVGQPVERVWVGVSGSHILSQESRGVVAVAKTDGEISEEDMVRVVEAAQTVATPLNYEVLHVLPRSFTVDGQTGIKDPVGMTGLRLEVDAQIIFGATPYVKNITKAVYRTGVDIDDLVLSMLATAEVILTSRQKDLGVAVVDIGGSTTTLLVFEGGTILHSAVIPIGSNHVTNDLALGLKTSIDVAERVKITVGECMAEEVHKKDIINLADFGGEDEVVPKKFIAEIINARVAEIMYKINLELNKIQRKALLPSGVVFTGGGAKLRGIIDCAKFELRMNAAYGFPSGIESATDKINDLSFTTAVGLVQWGMSVLQKTGSRTQRRFVPAGKMVESARKLFQFLIP